MLDSAKKKMLERAARNITPSETAIAKAVAEIIATLESDQADALDRLVDAAGLDIDVSHDPDAREEQLLQVADAVADDRVEERYLEEIGIRDVEDSLPYLGITEEEFSEQKREWWEKYRAAGLVETPVEQASEREIDNIARMHIESALHDDPDEWIRTVVGWNRGEAMQDLLAGPLVSHTQVIEAVADDLESDES